MSRVEDPRVDAATMDDLDAVAELWVDLARGQRQHGSTLLAGANREAAREWVARGIVTGELLVARPDRDADPDGDDLELLGFVGFSLERGGYERDHTRGTVSNLYVRPERRGEGIGAALLAAAEASLADAGAEAVALEALVDNERARAFYTEHGYEPNRIEFGKPLGDGTEDGAPEENGTEESGTKGDGTESRGG